MDINALIVNPELAGRNRLRQVTASIPEFKKVQLSTTLGEALERLNSTTPCNVIYLSSLFERAVVRQFMTSGRSTVQGRDSAYMMVFFGPVERQDAALLASVGIDGVLKEPFSADDVLRGTASALKAKGRRNSPRPTSAIDMIIDGAMEGLDKLAAQRKLGLTARIGHRVFKTACSPLPNLADEFGDKFYEQLVERFIAAPIPDNVPRSSEGDEVVPTLRQNRMIRVVHR